MFFLCRYVEKEGFLLFIELNIELLFDILTDSIGLSVSYRSSGWIISV